MSKRVSIFSVLVCLALTYNASADLTIVEDNYYGNAQTSSFKQAISGNKPLSGEDEKFITNNTPKKESGRFYAKLGLIFGQTIFQVTKNTSSGTAFTNHTLNKKQTSTNQQALDFALGYIVSDNFRMEIENFTNQTITYTANPIFKNQPLPQSLSASISTSTLLANAFYDITLQERAKAYLGVGLGVSMTKIATSLSAAANSGNRSTRSIAPTFALGSGLRLGLFSKCYVDFGYKFAFLNSKINLGPIGNFALRGGQYANIFAVSLNYLF